MKQPIPLWQTLPWIMVGGAFGAATRFLVGRWISGGTTLAWPWATFIINASGSFVLGFLSGWQWVQTAWGGRGWMLIAVGFLGAYTTFSTFSVELFQLIQRGAAVEAFIYGSVSPLSGLIAAMVGYGLAQLL